jgi:7,8-dihydroneopterin aldolase/epimerase/oxygenase
MNLQRITVDNIRLMAYHGCLPEEKNIGTEYRTDVCVWADYSASYTSDALSDTIDYVAITEIVCREMAIPSKLIEHVGNRIMNALFKMDPRIEIVELKLTKMRPPVHANVESVSVIISQKRQ